MSAFLHLVESGKDGVVDADEVDVCEPAAGALEVLCHACRGLGDACVGDDEVERGSSVGLLHKGGHGVPVGHVNGAQEDRRALGLARITDARQLVLRPRSERKRHARTCIRLCKRCAQPVGRARNQNRLGRPGGSRPRERLDHSRVQLGNQHKRKRDARKNPSQDDLEHHKPPPLCVDCERHSLTISRQV